MENRSESDLSCDVLIVGAGPAGLSVAATLDDDISVIIVHQDKEIGKPVRTSGGSWLSDVERLGIPKHLYQEMTSIDVFSDNECAHFDIKHQKPVVLDITGTYNWIAEKSKNKNRKILLSSKFMSTYRNNEKEYVSTIRSTSTDVKKVKSNYIVDASGTHCAVLNALSLGDKPSRVGVGIEYEYPLKGNDPDRAILFVGNTALSGYGWIFPTPDQKIRIGIGVIRPDTNLSPKELLTNFINSSALSKFGIEIEGDPLTVNAGTLPSVAYEPKLVFGNVIRVGDSANFATPTVGEGIRICIEKGELLGQQISKSMKGHSSKPLSSYEKTCRKTFLKNYWLGFQLNKRIASFTMADWDRSVRRLSRLEEGQVVALLKSEFSPVLAMSTLWKIVRRKIFSLK